MLDQQMRFDRAADSKEQPAYVIPMVYRVHGKLDLVRLKSAVETVVGRHESLRTTVHLDSEEQAISQSVYAGPEFDWAVTEVEDSEQATAATIDELCRRPFELAKGSLLRCSVFRVKSAAASGSSPEFVLARCAHHAVFDGLSLRIFLSEVSALYAGRELPELPLQYLDYSIHEHKLLASEECKLALNWWRKHLTGAEQLVAELPLDRPRSLQRSIRGASVEMKLSNAVLTGLREWQAECKCSEFMVFLAVLQLFVQRSACHSRPTCVSALCMPIGIDLNWSL